MGRENAAGLRQRSGARAAQPAAAQLGEKEQQALALKLLSKARAKQKEVEHVEARMDEIAEMVECGLNRDSERALLQEMSQLRHRKQALQKEAMGALDEAAELRPAGVAVTQRSGAVRGTPAASSTRPEAAATTKMSRAQRVAAESTPGALLKSGSGGETSKIDWCALAMVYVKAAAMFAFVFWLVRSEPTCELLAPCCFEARERSRHGQFRQTTTHSFICYPFPVFFLFLSLPRRIGLIL